MKYSLVINVIQFIGMEESGSEGLDDLIKSEAGPGKFFDGIDCFCIVTHPNIEPITPH
jgi:Cys-Gly metallodipeptidase DUG1